MADLKDKLDERAGNPNYTASTRNDYNTRRGMIIIRTLVVLVIILAIVIAVLVVLVIVVIVIVVIVIVVVTVVLLVYC